MRIRFADFAKVYGSALKITGEQHALADQTIESYAKIRHHLGQMAERWEDAVPVRDTMNDNKEARVKGTALTLAASSVMLKNATAMVKSFKGTIWEKRLDTGAADRSAWNINGLFRDVTRSLTSAENHEKIQRASEYLDSSMPTIQIIAIEDPERVNYVLGLVAYSDEVNNTKKETFVERQTLSISGTASSFASIAGGWMSSAMNALSEGFGNIVGNIHIGEATITGEIRDNTHDEMMKFLKPGDILLDKCEFAITDKIIQGHFGHVAVWLGTAEEMEEFGLFDSTVNHQSMNKVNEYEERLQSGHSVLEALRPGVQCNTLHDFLNVDEVAVMRLKQGSMSDSEYKAVITKTLTRGLYHLGQAYDFNFDVNTSNTIVCSELVYQAFPDTIHWPTAAAAGRLTISPDHVAMMAGPSDDMPFEVVYFNRHGKSTNSKEESWRPYWEAMKREGLKPSPDSDFNKNLLKAIESINP
jgi:uncharacterized protein YycO